MKPLVWALYLMLQDPSAGASSGGQEYAGQSWAFTGVTYRNKGACSSDAATFTRMPTSESADGVDADLKVTYVCVLQPKPGQY